METKLGFPRAPCRSLVQLMHEFIGQNYGNQREDIYQAVGKDEPSGPVAYPIFTLHLTSIMQMLAPPRIYASAAIRNTVS